MCLHSLNSSHRAPGMASYIVFAMYGVQRSEPPLIISAGILIPGRSFVTS